MKKTIKTIATALTVNAKADSVTSNPTTENNDKVQTTVTPEQQLKNNVDTTKANLDQSKANTADAQAVVDNLQKQADQTQSVANSAQTALNKAQQEANTAKGNVDQATQEVSNAETLNQNLDSKTQTAQSNVDTANKEVNAAQNDVNQATQEVNEKQQAVQTAQDNLNQTQNDLNKLNQQLAELQQAPELLVQTKQQLADAQSKFIILACGSAFVYYVISTILMLFISKTENNIENISNTELKINNNPLSFSGKIGRKAYFITKFLIFAICLMIYIISSTYKNTELLIFSLAFSRFIFFTFSLFAANKRLQDIKWNPLFLIIWAVPFLGLSIGIPLFFVKTKSLSK